ncbi:MAG: hypothetical protein AAF497_24950 [Planctomycetota bacterium]
MKADGFKDMTVAAYSEMQSTHQKQQLLHFDNQIATATASSVAYM